MAYSFRFVGPQPEGAHRREAARIHALAACAATPTMRKDMEDRARAHERLAGSREETGEGNAQTIATCVDARVSTKVKIVLLMWRECGLNRTELERAELERLKQAVPVACGNAGKRGTLRAGVRARSSGCLPSFSGAAPTPGPLRRRGGSRPAKFFRLLHHLPQQGRDEPRMFISFKESFQKGFKKWSGAHRGPATTTPLT